MNSLYSSPRFSGKIVMRNLLLFPLITLLCFCVAAPFSMASSPEKINNVVIGVDEWAPYHSQELKHFGYCTHIMVESFAAVGIEAAVHFIPWKRALNMSAEGELVDATIWGGYTDWIDTHYGSDPACRGEYVLFIKKDIDVDFNTPDSFKGLKMGNIIGEGIPDQLQPIVTDEILEVESATSVQSIFKMLANGRVDMVAMTKTTGTTAMREHLSVEQQKKITIHPERFRVSFYRLIVAKSDKTRSIELLEKFNLGLDILKQTGRLEQILEAERKGEYIK